MKNERFVLGQVRKWMDVHGDHGYDIHQKPCVTRLDGPNATCTCGLRKLQQLMDALLASPAE